MQAPQIIVIVIYAVSLLSSAHLHGKPRVGNNNFFSELAIRIALIALFWWGGFFS